MDTTNARQEHERNKRRRRRQLQGILIGFVLLVGIANIVRYAVMGVSALFDDTEEKAAYEQVLSPLVMLDPLPFDSLENADQVQMREYAVWATIFKAQRSESGLSAYERDPDTDALLLPAVEIDAALTALFGPDYKVTHNSFESSEMIFYYDEEKHSYLVPITGQTGQYNAKVEKLQKKDGKLYVTVGYVPTSSVSDFSVVTPTEPTKYMEFVFEKVDKQYYLRALQASEMKPDASASTGNTNNDVDYNGAYDPADVLANNPELDDMLQQGADSTSPSDSEPDSAAAAE